MKEIDYNIARTRLFFNNYFPGALMEHRHGMYAYVAGTNSRSEQVEKVNLVLLKEVINEQVALWRNMGGVVDGTIESALDNDTLAVRSPDEIYIKPSPLTFECTRCHLLHFNTGNSQDQIAKLSNIAYGDGPTLYCSNPDCRGKLKQFRFVNVHRCGAIQQITPPFAARGKQLRLRDEGTFFTTFWIDYATGHSYGNLFAPRCDTCSSSNLQGTTMIGAVIRDGRNVTFYPRLTQYISLTQPTTELLETALTQQGGPLEVGRAVLCGLLELQDQQTIRRHLRRLVQGDSGKGNLDELLTKKKKLEEEREKVQRMGMDDLTEAADAALNHLEEQIQQARGLFSLANQYIDNPSLLALLASSRRSREAAVLAGEFSSITLMDVLNAEGEYQKRAVLENSIRRLRQNYAIRELRYIENTSVVLASFGYSRELDAPVNNPQEVPVTLCGYIDEVSDELLGRTPVYVLPANTEAIHIRLDPRAVLRWAIDNLGWRIDDSTALSDMAMAHSLIIESAQLLADSPSNAYHQAKLRQDTNTLNILGLLHTIAHLLMRAAKQGSGYDENHLMEYIFPIDLSFIIYVASTTDYTTGGLLSLFRHNLPEWFDLANLDSLNCLYDPVCSHAGGSCHGCTQKSIGCETFNHGLSRAFLHGGIVEYPNGQQQVIQTGFWDE